MRCLHIIGVSRRLRLLRHYGVHEGGWHSDGRGRRSPNDIREEALEGRNEGAYPPFCIPSHYCSLPRDALLRVLRPNDTQ